MKIFKILLILAITSVTGIIIEACCHGYTYKWTYIISENLNNEEISKSDTISKQNFGIRLHLFSQKHSSSLYNPLCQSLYGAYDCFESYIREDSIVGFKILSIDRFNAEQGSHSDISDAFVVHYSEGNTYERILSIHELITQINDDYMPPSNTIDLRLKDVAITDTFHRFIIQITLSNKREMIDTTKAVRIK